MFFVFNDLTTRSLACARDDRLGYHDDGEKVVISNTSAELSAGSERNPCFDFKEKSLFFPDRTTSSLAGVYAEFNEVFEMTEKGREMTCWVGWIWQGFGRPVPSCSKARFFVPVLNHVLTPGQDLFGIHENKFRKKSKTDEGNNFSDSLREISSFSNWKHFDKPVLS